MHHHSDNPRGTDERVLTVQGIRSSLAEFAGLYVRARERWRAYDVYLSAMLIFAASRLVVIVGINFGTLLVRIPNPNHWEPTAALHRSASALT
jgi:hypothetical protein